MDKLKEELELEDQKLFCSIDLDLDSKMWGISDSFLDHYGPISAHLSSYNCAVEETIPSIVEEKGKINVTINGQLHTVIINNLIFQTPTHKELNENLVKTTSKICFDRSLTLKSDAYADLTYIGPNNQINLYPKKFICSMPVMKGSKLDPTTTIKHDKQKLADAQEDIHDTGGYFIIKGVPKILVHQVRPSHNNIHIYTGKTTTTNNKPKFLKYAETRSGSLISHTTTIQVGINAKNGLIGVMVPCIETHPIPLGVVFRALGVISEEEMSEYIFEKEWFENPPTPTHATAILTLVKSFEQSYQINTRELALEYINKHSTHNKGANKKKTDLTDEETIFILQDLDKYRDNKNTINYAQYILEHDLLPHIGSGSSFNKDKCTFLGYMARKLLLASVNLIPTSDRDHFINKRIHTSGMLLSAQFFKAFRQLCSKIVKSIEIDVKKKIPVNIAMYITTPHIITTNLMAAISSNKWNNSITSQGISQMMDDFNIVSKIAFLRKFVIPMANDGGKIELPRTVHGAQWGISCVTGDTLVTLADNSRIEIKDLNEKVINHAIIAERRSHPNKSISECADKFYHNQLIMSVNPITLESEPTSFHHFFRMDNQPILLIKADNGKVIKCTHDHPFLIYDKSIYLSTNTRFKFVQAGSLTKGMRLITTDLNENVVKANPLIVNNVYYDKYTTEIIEILDIGNDTVYDLTTTSENHTFIANGFVTSNCLSDTPEGKNVGLVQSCAMDMLVTVGCDVNPIIELLHSLNIVRLCEIKHPNEFLKYTRLFVNGSPYGYTQNPQEILDILRKMRRNGSSNPEISIAYDYFDDEIRISGDAGRVCRGLVILENGKPKISKSQLEDILAGKWASSNISVWQQLLQNGYTELISKEEEEMLLVAVYPSDLDSMSENDRLKYTHSEMTPDMILGASVSTGPFCDRNQAPRNIYQAGMAKQSVGVPGLNNQFHKRGKWHALVYPQRPLVSTRISRKLKFDIEAMGQNAIVCVMPWYGLNQEDSLILNETAVNRGFLCSYYYVAYEAIIKHQNTPSILKYETFEIPTKNCANFRGNPSKLVQFGNLCYVPQGVEVCKDDIIIGMVGVTIMPNEFEKDKREKRKNLSVMYSEKYPTTIHSVQSGYNGDGNMYIKVVTRQYRKPTIGDKLSAKPGQKGSIGALFPDEEMPYLKNLGYCPNILMNPLAFPSRMTIGLLVEYITGNELTSSALSCPEANEPLFDRDLNRMTLCKNVDTLNSSELKYQDGFNPLTDYETGITGDASPFDRSFSIRRVLESTKKMGYHEFSEEVVINNKTGEEITTLVFSGIAYYQRLKHMSIDKIHARATGSRHPVHRQPMEGRKNKGGFRVGHMERDFLAVSATVTLREGLSVRIGDLGVNYKKKYEKVWGWDTTAETCGLISSQQVDFGKKTGRCYIMTLQDGRTIEGSTHHPFYTNKYEWSEMKDLIIGQDRLACSIISPVVNFDEEIELCKDWMKTYSAYFIQLIEGKKKIQISATETYRRSLCFARLLGLVTSDGYISETTNEVHVNVDHLLDVESVINDVFRLTKTKSISTTGTKIRYLIKLPPKLSKSLKKCGGVQGNRINKDCYFPNFINDLTPLPIIREFLGGLFGGDGHTVCLSNHRDKHDMMKSVCFSWCRDKHNVNALQDTMRHLQKLLMKFNIESTIQAPKITTASKKVQNKSYEVVLAIPLDNLITFAEKIGFRYCENKAIKLSAGVSYKKFREGVEHQRLWICEEVDKLINYRERKMFGEDKIEGVSIAIQTAKNKLIKLEPLLHAESVPSQKMCGKLIIGKLNGGSNNVIRSTTFPTVEDYFNKIGVIDIFSTSTKKTNSVTYGVNPSSTSVPCFWLKIIDIRKKEIYEDVCDITVAKTESYVANGIIAHNCMLAHGTPEMVQDRLLYQSDVYIEPRCQICGLPAIDDGSRKYCNLCQTSKVVNVQLPYGTKLMSNELSVLNLVPRVITLPPK